MASAGLDVRRSQSGFSGLLLVFAILGACLLGLKYVGHRAEQEMRAEAHREWTVDKLKIKAALKGQSDCKAINFETPCTVGTNIPLQKKSGGVLVAADGSTKIGRWNVQIECAAKSPAAYWVMVAVRDGANAFHKDPLTRKPLGWSELVSLKDVCGTGSADIVLQKSQPCYGGIQGTAPLPPEIVSLSGCSDASCKYHNLYCGDNQRVFPDCPVDYQSTFRYVDRYGWGGIDFTKYTICTKL
ncbi:hypothetical protein [Oligoflexus tunisiensis]|uniref:hypothetical protein n=1 Tax=Oligoflexus tunisiensis TaxID=708132 RepID=UPI00114CFBC5|nr:hypothetical protein [Oligoflexus tunisiensis]